MRYRKYEEISIQEKIDSKAVLGNAILAEIYIDHDAINFELCASLFMLWVRYCHGDDHALLGLQASLWFSF